MQGKVDPDLPAESVPGAQLAFYFELVGQCLQTQASKRFDSILITSHYLETDSLSNPKSEKMA